jgi:hypothetical protein
LLAARRADRLAALSEELDGALAVPTDVTDPAQVPSITATEFGDGRFTLGATPRPGMVVHSPDYAADMVLRLLRTGEESFDIPHGPEQRAEVTMRAHGRSCVCDLPEGISA